MAWEYLRTEPFMLRYKIAAAYLKGKTKGKVIVDLNCGGAGLFTYLEKDFEAYHANDIFAVPMKAEKFHFAQIKDEDVDIKCDVLCLFGYGGGEYTGQPLESKTGRETILRLAEYNPQHIIIEMAQKWEETYSALSRILGPLGDRYFSEIECKINIPGNHYHNKRLLTILRRTDD